MDKIEFRVISKNDSGICSKCNSPTDSVFTVELADGSRSTRIILCLDCAHKLYLMIKKKNEDGSAYTQRLYAPDYMPLENAKGNMQLEYQNIKESDDLQLDFITIPQDNNYCPRCGQPVTGQSVFCSCCGTCLTNK